jgi:hypothetical protein
VYIAIQQENKKCMQQSLDRQIGTLKFANDIQLHRI